MNHTEYLELAEELKAIALEMRTRLNTLKYVAPIQRAATVIEFLVKDDTGVVDDGTFRPN